MVMPANSSLERMPKLTIEHDAPEDDAKATTRRRSIALRLDGKAWLRVEPEVFGELDVSAGHEIDAVAPRGGRDGPRPRARTAVRRSIARPRRCSRQPRSRGSSPRGTFRPISRGRRSSVSLGYGYLDDELSRASSPAVCGAGGTGGAEPQQQAARARAPGPRRRRRARRGLRRAGRGGARPRSARSPVRRRRCAIVVAPSRSLPDAASRPVLHGPRSGAPARRDRFRHAGSCEVQRRRRTLRRCLPGHARSGPALERDGVTLSSISRIPRTHCPTTGNGSSSAHGSRTRSRIWGRPPPVM